MPTGGSYGGGFAWLALTDPMWSSPGGKEMKLAATAPRYGWTDLVYSLVPNGHHLPVPGQAARVRRLGLDDAVRHPEAERPDDLCTAPG